MSSTKIVSTSFKRSLRKRSKARPIFRFGKTLSSLITLGAMSVFIVSCANNSSSENSFVGVGEFDTVEAAKTRVSLGLTYLKNGNYSQAKFNLDKALEFSPRSGEANYAMAFYNQEVGEYERAEEYYEKALSYSRNDPDVLNSYGAFLCKQGQYEKAKAYFLQAVDDKSYISAAETYENLAICSQNEGRIDEALRYFDNALNHQPNRASSLLYIAQLQTKQNNWEAAKKALWKYERNAKVTPDSLWLAYQIAKGQENVTASVEYADLLQRLFPEHEYTKQALAGLGKFQASAVVVRKQNNQAPATAQDSSITVKQDDNADAQNKQSSVLVPRSDALASTPSEVASNQSTVEAPQQVAANDANIDENSAMSAAAASNEQTNTQENESTSLNDDELGVFHIVQKKENLYRISLKYNVKIKKLLEWNNLKDASSIRSGTKLRVRDPNSNE